MNLRLLTTCAALLLVAMPSHADLIVEESQVPPFDLPDVLRIPGGQAIDSARDWEESARPALIELFEAHVYGRTPRMPVRFSSADSTASQVDEICLSVEDVSTEEIFKGKAVLRQARLRFSRDEHAAFFDVLAVVPLRRATPVPAIVALNFWGNHTVDAEPSIRRSGPAPGMESRERGSHAHRWNLEDLIERGYAVATAFRGEIAPDNHAHYTEGILALFPDNTGKEAMGAVGAWAWSLSRIADYLSSLPEIDPSRLVVAGHSRLGKAALWAAARDTRFSAVFANNTGCMGAALSRRRFGETVAIITRNFPFWFAPRLAKYADREDELPVDQHQLLALIAPRPLHLGAASEDLWADPRGEFLALREAAKVYSLFGFEPNLPERTPAPDAVPAGGVLRFHMREGPHDLVQTDWNAFLSPRYPEVPGG